MDPAWLLPSWSTQAWGFSFVCGGRGSPVLEGGGCGCERWRMGRGEGGRNEGGFLSPMMLCWMGKPLNARRMTMSWQGESSNRAPSCTFPVPTATPSAEDEQWLILWGTRVGAAGVNPGWIIENSWASLYHYNSNTLQPHGSQGVLAVILKSSVLDIY